MTPPGVKVPQFMELWGVVHALLEYTAKFADVVTVPVEDTVVDVVNVAKALSDKAIPIIINAATAIIIENFRFAKISFFLVFFSPFHPLNFEKPISARIHFYRFLKINQRSCQL
jgi:hypothetical protein